MSDKLREMAERIHFKLAAAQNLPYEEGDVCDECQQFTAELAALADAASVGAGEPDNYFTRLNANIRNAEQFAADVEFIHACHIEGAITGACRQVFERRERAAFEAGRALGATSKPAGEPRDG